MAANEATDTTQKSPKPPRVGRLRTLGDVVSEMAKVYRSCRRGDLPRPDGSRLVYMLTSLRQSMESSDLERRIVKLEVAMRDRRVD